ncbi:transporter substrate-binding domain-containing protein [Puniceicoccaceae bacterium K14]|nr:transporter substrate-binding domain-containing protein [Puniceicoccaceae bacterium K14]
MKTPSHARLQFSKQVIGSLLGLLTILFISACSTPKDDSTLVVGMELAYPPFEMTDEQNNPTGVSVEMAQALAKHLGRELRIENIPFAGLIPALRTGKIDVIISSMTATDERRESIDFSDAYLSTGLCLLVSKNSAITSIDELDKAGVSIAVKQGTTGHVYAASSIKHANVLLFDKESAAVLEVSQEKADAFIYDQMSTFMNWKRNQETTTALLNPLKKESWAIGIAKSNEALLSEINDFLATFSQSGGFDSLGEKYLKEQKEEFEKLGIPFYF